MNRHMGKFVAFGAAAMLLAGTAMAAQYGSSHSKTSTRNEAATNWYGGPIYHGKPDLKLTAALVKAGGGAENFSFSKALVSMLGQKTVNKESAKLTKQYGKKEVQTWLNGTTYIVNTALKEATAAGVKLPEAPANLKGKRLAKALVKAGTAPDGTFWAGHLFDRTVSHKIHNKDMAHVNKTKGGHVDMVAHKITNQAMYDVAHALGMKHVKLASLH